MANVVTSKLTNLSNQYSTSVEELRELEAKLRNKGAGVSDAEAKRLNGLINALDAKRKTISDEYNKLKKLEKPAKDYTSLQGDIKDIQAQIDKAKARGENTTALDAKKTTLTGKFNGIAPAVEAAFPDIKVKPTTAAGSTKTGPLGNVQLTTGATLTPAAASKQAATKSKVPTPAAGDKPKPPPTKAKVVPAGGNTGAIGSGGAGGFTDSQNAARLAQTGNQTGTTTVTGNQDINAIYALAKSKYGNVDSIFLYDDELKKLLIEAVKDPATAEDDMEPEEFLRRVAASDWAIRNATTYAKRDSERREYTETLDKYNQQLQLADTQQKKDDILSKIGQLKDTSAYARGLASAKAYIESVASGLTGTMSPERLDAFVKKMYDSANDKDPNIINRELAALISYKPGTQLGGAIGGDLTTLRATARANGFDLDTQFGSSINDWLQRLAKGESIETFKNTIRGAAKLGLPDKVANLLDQGLDIKDIYAPYRNVMASVLEVAPDSIGLDDKTLRSAIGPEKEMSLYDFQRTLRNDPRWQYTDNARQETSSTVLGVLRDFGFQG
tara:strand:+ start:49 stop:1719 length:1671 start_codon:yes stop_codon:yes gene_type:complete